MLTRYIWIPCCLAGLASCPHFMLIPQCNATSSSNKIAIFIYFTTHPRSLWIHWAFILKGRVHSHLLSAWARLACSFANTWLTNTTWKILWILPVYSLSVCVFVWDWMSVVDVSMWDWGLGPIFLFKSTSMLKRHWVMTQGFLKSVSIQKL